MTKFARRWWCSTNTNVALISVAAFAAVIAFMWPIAGLLTAAVAVVAPLGLGVRGRTSRLAWTRRLRTSAVVSVVITLVLVLVAGLLLDRVAAMMTATGVLAPLLVDAALLLVSPLEQRLARRHTSRAAATLERIGPLVVAITGSYGKTTTKQLRAVT